MVRDEGMEGWREGEEKKVSLLIVSERAQTLVVVGESGLACSGGMRQPRRGADAGNDSDDRFFFLFFFCLLFFVTASLHASGCGRGSFASQRFIGL